MQINSDNLDIVIRTNDYAIYNQGEVLTTPDGHEFSHSGNRLLQHILRELTFYNEFLDSNINCYSLYSYQKDFIEVGLGLLSRKFDEILEFDPFIRKKFRKDIPNIDKTKSAAFFSELDSGGQPLHFLYGGTAVISRVFNDFLYERMPKGYDPTEIDYREAAAIISNYYNSLSDAQKAGVNLLAKYHLSGIITPMFLVNLLITPSEYANAVFNLNLPQFVNSKNLSVYRELFENDSAEIPVLSKESPRRDFEKVKDEALSAVEYIVLLKQEVPGTPNLDKILKEGESYNTEFKSTFRMNLKSGKKDPNIEHASLKTIAAFLNSNGGVLLIGVKDNGEIEGIESDAFDNEDKFSLHFWNMVKSTMGQDISSFLQTNFEHRNDKTIFTVRCLQSTRPVFLKQSGFGEEFFIRVGPSSAKLDISEALQFINDRFG